MWYTPPRDPARHESRRQVQTGPRVQVWAERTLSPGIKSGPWFFMLRCLRSTKPALIESDGFSQYQIIVQHNVLSIIFNRIILSAKTR